MRISPTVAQLGGVDGERVGVADLGRSGVGGGRMGPVGQLADHRECAVAGRVGAGGVAAGERPQRPRGLQVVVRVADVDQAVDALGQRRDPRCLRLAPVQLDAHRGRDRLQRRVQGGLGAAQVEVGAADLAVVQRDHQRGPVLVDQPHQGERLGQHRVEPHLLVVEREGPLDLLRARLAVEVACVVLAGERALQPALVEPQPVGIDARDDVPAVPEPGPQAPVRGEPRGQVQGRQPADRLVRVRQPDHQRVRGAGPGALDRQAGQRLAQRGRAHPAQGDDARGARRRAGGWPRRSRRPWRRTREGAPIPARTAARARSAAHRASSSSPPSRAPPRR